jgi:hypothetical protein
MLQFGTNADKGILEMQWCITTSALLFADRCVQAGTFEAVRASGKQQSLLVLLLSMLLRLL